MPKGVAATEIAAAPSFALGVPPIGEHEQYADADSGAATDARIAYGKGACVHLGAIENPRVRAAAAPTVSKCFCSPVLAGNPLRNAFAQYFLRKNCATLNRQDDPVTEK